MENELLEREEIQEEATEPTAEEMTPCEATEEMTDEATEESSESVDTESAPEEATTEGATEQTAETEEETTEVAPTRETAPEEEKVEEDVYALAPKKEKTLKDRLNSISLLLLLVAFAIPVSIIAYILIKFFLM